MGWKERLEAMLAGMTPAEDPRTTAGRMREALIEMRAAVGPIREALAQSEKLLAATKAEAETAERRRVQAEQIQDAETVEIATKYAAKNRERLAVLEQKVAAQRAELALAEADLAEMQTEFTQAAKNIGGAQAGQSAGAAWAGLGAAGQDHPDVDPAQEALGYRIDRAAIEADANAKLEELKRRMGKQ